MIIENEYFNLFLHGKNVIIRTKKYGFPLKSFDAITREQPRLKINSFPLLRQAITTIGEEHVIGTWLPLLELVVSSNNMEVHLIANVTVNELDANINKIVAEAELMLTDAGIIYGRKDLGAELFIPTIPILVAEGTKPEKGVDAIITYIDPPKRQPVIREDGLADYYEMNFVFPINEGDWLGEKIHPLEGQNGMDVYGKPIIAARGNDALLCYDRKTVYEEKEAGKTIIRALHGGALEFKEGNVSVGKRLIIDGNVGPETGTISFDGSVVIYGTVLDGYSVTATGDISIEGNESVTNAKLIQSSEGDIYIKGGVFGGGTTILEAQGNIYLKHANDCKLFGKEVHIGLYLFSSEVIAEYVYVDKLRGKIIGGKVEVLYRIETAIAGNSHERTTILHAKGVDKESSYKEIQALAQDLKKRQEVVSKLEVHIAKFDKVSSSLHGESAEAYNKMLETVETNKIKIIELDQEIQLMLNKIKNAVPAKIEVTKEANPGTIIQIGKAASTLHTQTKGVFEISDGVLNV